MKQTTLSLTAGGVLVAGLAAQASATSPYRACPPSRGLDCRQHDASVPRGQPRGSEGNNDGIVCAKPVDSKTFQYDRLQEICRTCPWR